MTNNAEEDKITFYLISTVNNLVIHGTTARPPKHLTDSSLQPPKRTRAAGDTASSSRTQAPANRPRAPRRSARTGLTADEEAEAREAFGLFALHGLKGFEADEAGALRVADVRKVLVLVFPPAPHIPNA